MSNILNNPTLRKKFTDVFNIPIQELEDRAYKKLVKDELNKVDVEIFKILNRYGIKNAQELDRWFQDNRISEAEGWEDFFVLGNWEHKRTLLQEILKELS